MNCREIELNKNMLIKTTEIIFLVTRINPHAIGLYLHPTTIYHFHTYSSLNKATLFILAMCRCQSCSANRT